MLTYDLCLAWNWEYDLGFVHILDDTCRRKGLSLLQITPHNLGEMFETIQNNQVYFRFFWDRASEVDDRFLPLTKWVLENDIQWINHNHKAARTWNKAALHYQLIDAGLHTPHTIILPSYREQEELKEIDFSILGNPFIMKPAHGSGGEGVVLEVYTFEDIIRVRQEHSRDQYLLQTKIIPCQINSQPAWFRNIYCDGKVYLCWWNPYSHIYLPISDPDEAQNGLKSMREIVFTLAKICRLDLFSTEIARTSDGLFVVVDYINDEIDLRLQSHAQDGVPDSIIVDITDRLTNLVLLAKNTVNKHRSSV